MRRTQTVLAIATATAVALVIAPSGAWASPETAYADGFVQRSAGTGTATASIDANREGELALSAHSVGGTKFLLPIVNLLPYSTPTTVNGQAYISDGIDEAPGVEAGHDYRITVSYGDVDVETSEEGNGQVTTEIWAQASAGSDGAGHTLVAGAGRDEVTEDGTAVLEFDIHVTQDSPVGVQAGIQVRTSATGAGNEASADLSAVVTDVQIDEIG